MINHNISINIISLNYGGFLYGNYTKKIKHYLIFFHNNIVKHFIDLKMSSSLIQYFNFRYRLTMNSNQI